MSAATRSPRLTPVQRDILDRMRDGWVLEWTGVGYRTSKPGEPSRHVRERTAHSLVDRGLVKLSTNWGRWTLA